MSDMIENTPQGNTVSPANMLISIMENSRRNIHSAQVRMNNCIEEASKRRVLAGEQYKAQVQQHDLDKRLIEARHAEEVKRHNAEVLEIKQQKAETKELHQTELRSIDHEEQETLAQLKGIIDAAEAALATQAKEVRADS